MTNLGPRTRRQQILERLVRARGEWVDGSELATESIGGSEGLRRLRELVAEGYPIIHRRHPNPDRSIWQYRYQLPKETSPLRSTVPRTEAGYTYVPTAPVLPLEENEPQPEPWKFTHLPAKIDFGAVAVCPRCHGKTRKKVFENLRGERHKDPHDIRRPCQGCNGWGIIPNKGPIPLTHPEDQR